MAVDPQAPPVAPPTAADFGPEPGYATTEFWLATATSAATLAGAALVDFNVVALNAAQKADITSAAVLAVSIIAAAYALGRSIRKQGQ